MPTARTIAVVPPRPGAVAASNSMAELMMSARAEPTENHMMTSRRRGEDDIAEMDSCSMTRLDGELMKGVGSLLWERRVT